MLQLETRAFCGFFCPSGRLLHLQTVLASTDGETAAVREPALSCRNEHFDFSLVRTWYTTKAAAFLAATSIMYCSRYVLLLLSSVHISQA